VRAASASAPCEVLDCRALARATPRCANALSPAVPDDPAMVDDLLKLGGGFFALPSRKICLAANVHLIEAGNIDDERNSPQLDG
jgi:hypothetical protein